MTEPGSPFGSTSVGLATITDKVAAEPGVGIVNPTIRFAVPLCCEPVGGTVSNFLRPACNGVIERIAAAARFD